MRARPGDRITIEGRTVGSARRVGTVEEVLGSGRRYRIRWDDGRESTLAPGTDMRVERDEDERGDPATPTTQTLTTTAAIRIDEDADHAEALVTLTVGGREYVGHGSAARNPSDPVVPAIGEELAAARALADLSHQLLEAASRDIGSWAGSPGHVRL